MAEMGSLRERNRLRVVDALRRTGPASRADIARTAGLSRATVSSLVGELVDAHVLVERRDDATPRTGRPPVLLALDRSAGAALGVDFGHHHLRVAVTDLNADVLAERRLALDVDHDDAGAALDTAARLVEDLLAEADVPRDGVIGCGMGLPGPVARPNGTVGSSVILPGWAGRQGAAELSERIGLPVAVDNDANLGALAEMTYGAARGAHDLIYVKVASGVGAGLVLGGRLHHGTRGLAGELGHVHVDPAGRVCRCGKRGCLETVAAAPALLSLLREAHGEDLTLDRMVDLVRAGEVGPSRVVQDAGRAIGRALSDASNLLNPELIVVGGDLARAGEPLLEGIRESLSRYALPEAAASAAVTAGVLGERAGVLGALALVIADTENLRSAQLGSLSPPSTQTSSITIKPIQGGGSL